MQHRFWRLRFASRVLPVSASSRSTQLIEPAVAFLHEHAIQRAHTADTLRTYTEILYDWFDIVEQNDILGTRRMLSTWLPIATA